MGENNFATWPVAIYGVILLMNAIAYTILSKILIQLHGTNSTLAKAVGKDVKGIASLALYLAAILVAFINSWISITLYATVAIMGFIPDKRIEKKLVAEER